MQHLKRLLDQLMQAALSFVDVIAAVLVVAFWCLLLYLTIIYLVDRIQSKHAIRRNYPIIGRFRYLFEHLGEYFRQYFFAMHREEMPFNRA